MSGISGSRESLSSLAIVPWSVICAYLGPRWPDRSDDMSLVMQHLSTKKLIQPRITEYMKERRDVIKVLHVKANRSW